MILWACAASIAQAADLSESDAQEIARLFYRQTGRQVPEAFLADDVDALIVSGHDTEELTHAVVWIARNVPGAESYTLAGILESHLAAALGYDEELVLPEGFDPDQVLGEAHERDAGWLPGPEETQELLTAYYGSTGRTAPSPPTADDLAGFSALADEGWTEGAVRTLVAWVPTHLRGVEQLTWGQVAGLAADKGYLSGPRPNGEMESLQGVSAPDEEPAHAWGVDRDPLAWDGGWARARASMGALEGASDRARVGARLARPTSRTLELRGDAVGRLPSGTATVSRTSSDVGWLVEASYGSAVSGRAAVGHTLGHALPGTGAVIGAGVWGSRATQQSDGGASASLGFGDTLQVLGHGSLGGVREQVDGVAVAGQVASLELTPRLELGPMWVEAHARGQWRSGGLLDDGPPIYDDAWSERRAGLEVQAGYGGARTRVAGGVVTEAGSWSLTWVERTDADDLTRSAGALQQGQVFLGGEANVWGTVWLTGGTAVLFGDQSGVELAAGARMNLNEISWLAVYGRVGQVPSAGLQLGIPL